jgi:bacteriocin biosynthesis cyclodehydratase domain-containing protein
MEEPAADLAPWRPLLKPWYRLSLDEESAVLRYGGSVLELDGAAVTRLLPHLLPLLDGAHTLDEIVDEIGQPVRPAVERALEVLSEHRLLTDGLSGDVGGAARTTLDLLSATDPHDRSPAELAPGLANASARVVGAGATAAQIVDLLRASGLGSVEPCAWNEQVAGEDALAIVAPEAAEVARVRDWNRLALAGGSPWLQVLPFDGLLAAVGPLFVPGETGCHECYRLRRNANLTSLREADEPPRGIYPSAPAVDALLATLASLTALRAVALGEGSAAGVLLAVELAPQLVCTRHVVYRVPRCPSCSRTATIGTPSPWSGAVVAA